MTLGCLLLGVFQLYALAFGADTGFDDDANLSGLSGVHDAASAWRFVLSGGAGPLGRPLALASFLLNASAWPSAPAELLRTNALIHLLNIVLVAWFALRLSDLLPRRPARPEWFALAVAAAWGVAPLLMSASLMAVQRMTTLAASFCLAGLIAWLGARRHLATAPSRAMTGMTLSLGVASLLAILCKEIGVLLPLLVAVIELTLARQALGTPQDTRARRAWAAWQILFFGAPLLLLGDLAWMHLRDPAAAYQGLGYGPGQRLLEECAILFRYLRCLLLPQRADLGPFHDDVLVAPGLPEAFAAIAWLALCIAAWYLRRGPWRIVSFALGWFLAAHLLESTIFPLEPYFEHRNYLPAVGVMFASCAALWEAPGRARAAGRLLLPALVVNAVFTAHELAIIWADPRLAGPLWAAEHPLSMRALMYHSRTTGMAGELARSVAIFDAAPEELRQQPRYIAARLQLYCGTQDEARVAHAATALGTLNEHGRVDYDTPQSLGVALDLAALERCPGFDPELGRAALEALLELPRERVLPRAEPVVHEILARYWARKHRIDWTLHHLEREYELNGSADAIGRIVWVLGSAGRCDAATTALHDAEARHSWNPLRNASWKLRLEPVREAWAQYCGASARGH